MVRSSRILALALPILTAAALAGCGGGDSSGGDLQKDDLQRDISRRLAQATGGGAPNVTCPSNLPLKEFVYQSTFQVPDHPFGVRVTKLMQPSLPGLPQSSGLFVDCDVFTTRPLDSDEALEDALGKMRWLKNKIFFTLMTEQAIQSFQ